LAPPRAPRRTQEIKELLDAWRPYFDASTHVFYYLPGGGSNRHMFFYEGSPLGTKKGKGRVSDTHTHHTGMDGCEVQYSAVQCSAVQCSALTSSLLL
jgi:hypothetical protein